MKRFTQPRVALFAAVVMLIVATVLMGEQLTVRRYSPLTCLVEDTRTGGGSAVHDWARRMGYSTVPFRPPIQEAGKNLTGSGHCFITAGNRDWNPLGADFAASDWIPLRQWIEAGNTLIVITGDSKSLPEPIQDHFTSADETSGQQSTTPPSFESSKLDPLSLAPVEYELVSTRWNGSVSVRADGPRLQNAPREWQIAGAGNRSVIAARPLKQGMIYLLLDDSAWNNEGFDRADNAATLARVLKQHLGPQGLLAFDEYRHGHGRIESFTTLFLSLPGATSFATMATVWGLFSLWGSTRRLSPPEAYRETERRTALEYIQSVAGMNQRARAAPLAVNSVLQRIRYLFQKRGISSETADAVLKQAEDNVELADRPATPKDEIKLVTELIQLRKELYGTRKGS